MSKNLRGQAKRLAARAYTVTVLIDASEPDEPLYLALNPELEGCMAQGETAEEAVRNLAEFRVDYIEHLLEHNLPVPAPAGVTLTGDSGSARTINVRWDFRLSALENDVDKAVQSENLKHLAVKRA